MSDETTELALVPSGDFTLKDMEQIQKFKDEGLIGLASVDLLDIERAMALYIDGKTYRQITNTLKIKKEVILWAAHKYKWHELRTQYLEELGATLPTKVLESKLQSQEFFLHLILAYQKKIGKNIDKYLRTNDEQWHDKVDVKDINTLLKITELLHNLDSQNLSNPGDKSLINLNGMGEGMTITKTGANSVEITPKSPFSSKLKQFADIKREQEKAKETPVQSHDISKKEQITPE
ncbi:MAG TPA: hypothetical protein VIJ14_05615, partial [Rhabdochlamydiaceae bacterium]